MQIKPISVIAPLYKFYVDNLKNIVIYVVIFYVSLLMVKKGISELSFNYSEQLNFAIQIGINVIFSVVFVQYIFKKLDLVHENEQRNTLIVVAFIYFFIIGLIDDFEILFISKFYASHELFVEFIKNLLMIFFSFASYFVFQITYTKKNSISKIWINSFYLAKRNIGTIIVLYVFFGILTFIGLFPVIILSKMEWFYNFIYSNSVGGVIYRIYTTFIIGIILSMRIFAKCIMYSNFHLLKKFDGKNGI